MDIRTLQELRTVISNAIEDNSQAKVIGTGGSGELKLFLEATIGDNLIDITINHQGKL